MNSTDATTSPLPARLRAELVLARYLGRDFRGADFRAAALGLPLLLDYLALDSGPGVGIEWSEFDPREYVALVRDLEDDEALFLRALLSEARVFFGYLRAEGELGEAHAMRIDVELGRALVDLEA